MANPLRRRLSRISLHDNGGVKKHIYIYSPSGAVRDKAAFKRGVRHLEQLGHRVEIDVDALKSYMRFAGDDATRLAAIHRAAASGADMALISRGGYGLTRILGGIRYKAVAKAIERGTDFVGISDFTAFQSALFTKTGAISWAGPALCEGFGAGGTPDQLTGTGQANAPGPDEIMVDCFSDLLLGQGEGTGWRQHPEQYSGSALEFRKQGPWAVNDARIWGGNLAVLTSLLGTPYFPDIKGGLLFLEDVAEPPYRVERMLTQLLHAGVLARQKAILMGQFSDFKLTAHDKGFKLQTVFDWLRSQLKVPVFTNLPYGHVATKVLLPVGAKADLVVEGRDALMVWGHLS
jgi:muramoyltetrapeptide carboxypeptidase